VEKIRLKVQLACLALLNLGVFQWQTVCFPVLNCHSCPTAIFACPVGIIGQFVGLGLIPLSVVGVVALAGLTVGRFLCGWVCPFGLFQDLLYKIPYIKFDIPRWTRFIKYGVFAGLVVAVPFFLTPAFPAYFCRLCPVATIESAIPWAIINGTTDVISLSIRLAILFAIVVAAMGHRRFFCKTLCPLGAIIAPLNRFAAVFPQRNKDCTDCGVCNKVCPMETSHGVSKHGVFEGAPEECISCLECQKKCPTDAIKLWG
jgi:ferredoxin-type protein NapH